MGYDKEIGELVFEIEIIEVEKMFYIVVVIDEMVDLMMVVGKEIEVVVQCLVQMVCVVGIYLVIVIQ